MIFGSQKLAVLHIAMIMDYQCEKRLSIDILKYKSPGTPVKAVATLGSWSVDRKIIHGCVLCRPESRA